MSNPDQEHEPTLQAVLDWYLENGLQSFHPVALKERLRVWKLFCAHRGADDVPFGDQPYTAFKPFHLLEFIKRQDGLLSAWTRKRWVATIQATMNAAARLGFITWGCAWPAVPRAATGRTPNTKHCSDTQTHTSAVCSSLSGSREPGPAKCGRLNGKTCGPRPASSSFANTRLSGSPGGVNASKRSK